MAALAAHRPGRQGQDRCPASAAEGNKETGEEGEQRMCCRWRDLQSKLPPDARRGDEEEEAGRSAEGAGQCGWGGSGRGSGGCGVAEGPEDPPLVSP